MTHQARLPGRTEGDIVAGGCFDAKRFALLCRRDTDIRDTSVANKAVTVSVSSDTSCLRLAALISGWHLPVASLTYVSETRPTDQNGTQTLGDGGIVNVHLVLAPTSQKGHHQHVPSLPRATMVQDS
jgi:hypothetical protein